MKDWRGNEIEIGSRVIYAFNTSTSVIAMAEGVVMEFPPLESRQRVQRAKVLVDRSTVDPTRFVAPVEIVLVNRLTVLHDTA